MTDHQHNCIGIGQPPAPEAGEPLSEAELAKFEIVGRGGEVGQRAAAEIRALRQQLAAARQEAEAVKVQSEQDGMLIECLWMVKERLKAYTCRGCGKLLEMTSLALRTCDGCPCNSPRGINHGLVAKEVCTCTECDPKGLGASRIRDYYEVEQQLAAARREASNAVFAAKVMEEVAAARDAELARVRAAAGKLVEAGQAARKYVCDKFANVHKAGYPAAAWTVVKDLDAALAEWAAMAQERTA